jgi:two-component system sensor histidine kinase PilS (NtrC family)
MAPHSTSQSPGLNLSPPAVPEDSAFQRLWRGFMTARVAIAVVLVLLFGTLWALGATPSVNGWLIGLCLTYLAAAAAVRAFTQPLPPGRAFDPQWVSTIGVDLLVFSTLQFLQAGGLNYLPLFALPVLTGAVLGSGLLALGTAAAVTLLLLVDAWVWALQQAPDYPSRFVQAGLTGIGYFAVALLANQLAARLAREERAARRSQIAARTQAQVNELVIEQLGDGVLVVGMDNKVYAANPAARRMLGCTPVDPPIPFALDSRGSWRALMELASRTFVEQAAQVAELAVVPAPGERQLVHVRTRLTRAHDPSSASLCVVFLEDLREVEARLRTEKLAAMGRMSAAVAHEIRNPLAAIAQANALLEEELSDAAQRQLSAMVRQNAQRLSHIVEEILDIARVQQQTASPSWLALDATVRAVCEEWARHMQAEGRLALQLGAGATRVVFHEEHLRRVLVNLLDNALRYAGHQPDSIRVATRESGGEASLVVWSDGPPIEQGVQRHLFEPFFSSESRSSGLGLYICRELCERHGASIGWRRAAAVPGGREGNEFFVRLRLQSRPAAAPFDTIKA